MVRHAPETTDTKGSRSSSESCRLRSGKMAGAMADVLRIAASCREGIQLAVFDDVVRRLMGLDAGEDA